MSAPVLTVSPLPDWLTSAEVQQLMHILTEGGVDTRFVGGCVRNLLLQEPVGDLDIATPLVPHEVIARLRSRGLKVVPTGLNHGTVTAVIGKRSFEITTLRTDQDCDGRHAEVTYTESWREDAQRRDFTINALSMTLNGDIFDYTQGIEDIKNRRVRFIGEPEQRIREDYLRILRFFRFFAVYGEAEVDRAALAAITSLSEGIENLSGERIQSEMKKLLQASQPVTALKMMVETGVAVYVMPVLPNIKAVAAMVAHEDMMGITPCWRRRLVTGLWEGKTTAISFIRNRWKLSRLDGERLEQLMSIEPPVPTDETSLKRLLRRHGVSLYTDIMLLAWARNLDGGTSDNAKVYRKALNLPEIWQIPEFPISGADLLALGIAAGPQLGRHLSRLELDWENENYLPSRDDLLSRINNL